MVAEYVHLFRTPEQKAEPIKCPYDGERLLFVRCPVLLLSLKPTSQKWKMLVSLLLYRLFEMLPFDFCYSFSPELFTRIRVYTYCIVGFRKFQFNGTLQAVLNWCNCFPMFCATRQFVKCHILTSFFFVSQCWRMLSLVCCPAVASFCEDPVYSCQSICNNIWTSRFQLHLLSFTLLL